MNFDSIETPQPGTVPELLAPAGDWECVKAAVENGADAVYFGLEKFNARMRARNFTVADLPGLMAFLHRRGVRGYVTFNTLVFANELAEAEQFLRAIIAAGVDAAIVQDIGICRLIRRLSPDFPIHASTQMTVTSAAGVAFARELGCHLVVLARECSLKEIAAIRGAGAAANTDVPLEVFVHGALCVAYSGQCLTSESLGGRSANRGECAQACRMPYELISDGRRVELGDRRYLLSPQDLAGLEVLPELIASGVSSLKIEGRLKSPEYVASITRVYRRALDDAAARAAGLPAGGQADVGVAEGAAAATPRSSRQDAGFTGPGAPAERYELEMAFSRGLYTGWFRGINNQELAHARFGKKRGVYLGEVRRVLRDAVVVEARAPLKAGDGIVFDQGQPDQPEEGGRVFQLRNQRSNGREEAVLTFREGAVNFARLRIGDRVWKTDDPKLNRELRQTFEGEQVRFPRPVDFEVHGHAGTPLTLLASDRLGNVTRIESDRPLVPAEKRPLTEATLREQLGRLGGTPFQPGELLNRLEGGVMLPVSELNRLRREAVARLEELRARPRRWTLREPVAQAASLRKNDALNGIDRVSRNVPSAGHADAELIVLIRRPEQLPPVIAAGVRTVYCDFEFPRQYAGFIKRFRDEARARGANTEVFLAPPRIFKPGEEWILEQVRAAAPDGFLARNYDHLRFFAGGRLRGDFSLNIANELAAEHFMRERGLERITASYDLNNAQLAALLAAAPPEWFEVTIHQHMPMFHMEHCVFCAFLSTGKDYRDCGRPCEQHDVKLRDRVGLEHPLKADAGCRNTVYNARAQTGAESVQQLLAAGLRSFRVDFVNEPPGEVARTIARYQSLLRGEISGADLWRELKLHSQLGVTRGQQFVAGR